MPYDSEKDETIKTYEKIDMGRDNSLVVKIVKYDNGSPKLLMQKQFANKDGEERVTNKIGRLDLNTVMELKKIIDDVVKEISNPDNEKQE